MNTDKQNDRKISPSERVKIHLNYQDHFFRIEQNEELQSERIIKFFLALTTGIIVIFTILMRNNISKEILYWILAVFIIVLFVLGLFVFARVIWSDRKIKQMRQLRAVSYEAIKTFDPSVAPYRERLKEMNDSRIWWLLRMSKGTLTQIMWLIEGILIEALMFVLVIILELQLTDRIILLIIPVGFVLTVLYCWAEYIKQGIDEKNENNIDKTV